MLESAFKQRLRKRIPSHVSIHFILLAACLGFTSTVQAGIHFTLMGSGSLPQAEEISLITELKDSSLPLKKSLKSLYQLRNYKLIWSDGEKYNDNAKQLLSTIQQSHEFGLNAFDYDAESLQSFLQKSEANPTLLGKSDILFSHAYVKLASHISRGKLTDSQATFNNEELLLATLNEGADNNAIHSTINDLQPKNNHYRNLVAALTNYKQIEARIDHQQAPLKLSKRSYQLGDYSSEIPKLRTLLHVYGDYRGNDLSSQLLDEPLMLAVSEFQSRHGLDTDGVVGKQTVRALNTPIWKRIQQLELNLARARSLPDLSTGRHLLVNIPAYKLYLYDDQQLTYQSNVVVGKKKHKTPLITSELTKIILSPYWNVPKSITYNEIVPAIQRDPNYLAKNNMKLLSTDSNQARIINPETIDWFNIDQANTNFRVRQEPGVRNSLGNIKFIFPNRHSVYLHDTPSRRLFALPQRAFSHGCIRVEDPFGLAETLISNDLGWSKYDLLDLSKQSKSKTVPLSESVPIHITYMTAWADEQGIVNFRPDIYNRDTQVLASLYNADN
ncbi:MAG: murein L,D-transpeptidase [Gammaproteobacteria bacterium]